MKIEWDCPRDIRVRTLRALLLFIPTAIWALNAMLRNSWAELTMALACVLVIGWVYRDI
jgi:hypothetical protein